MAIESAAVICDAAICAVLCRIAVRDWQTQLIANQSLCLLAVLAWMRALIAGSGILESFIGMSLCFLFLAALFFAGEGLIGAGDVKLAGALGIWLGWPDAAPALCLSFILGGTAAAACLVLRFKNRSDHIAFAPFMAVSAAAMHFCGTEIVCFWQSAIEFL